ncbi:L,D-transpeptidase [Rhodoferax sp.]|uniref:L,D-transpeptidase n=1 Tax=Rhodoferax sp. TaxID=50421 RepID=UPI00273476C6|nr:L,D-transpeptidase [Rhodoferax sp.]MDP3190307.1 L,D-transpeptidase [Rhodoferax sp.]
MTLTGLNTSLLAAVLFTASGSLSAQTQPLSDGARQTVAWVKGQRDLVGLPFVVLDKRLAHAWVFDANARLAGATPVLLGSAKGDDSVPGIGEKPIGSILPHERTTPAGRFPLEPGKNAKGERIYWVDYDAAVSMHRVRSANASERRLDRLATSDVGDNRISYGCINVPEAFYNEVIDGLFASGKGSIYILPETRPISSLLK